MPKPPPQTPELSYVVTVNGQTQMYPAGAPTLPCYLIAPGEDLAITVEVTVPSHDTLTGLWLGITNDWLTFRDLPDGSPDMDPILAARTGTLLGPGAHRSSCTGLCQPGCAPGTAARCPRGGLGPMS